MLTYMTWLGHNELNISKQQTSADDIMAKLKFINVHTLEYLIGISAINSTLELLVNFPRNIAI